MPRWRIFTWVILVINVLFLIWVVTGAVSSSNAVAACHADQYLSKDDCQSATGFGSIIGLGLIVAFWVAVDFICGILWLITRPKLRTCPRCGTGVKKGRMVCRKCNYDFALAYQQGPRMQPGYPQPMPSMPPQAAMPPLPQQVQPQQPDVN